MRQHHRVWWFVLWFSATGILALIFAGVSACSQPTDNNNNQAQESTLTLGGYSLQQKAKPWRLELRRGEEVLSTLSGKDLTLGYVRQVDDGYNYDPYWLTKASGQVRKPVGLSWLVPTTIERQQASGKKLRFTLRYDKDITATLEIEAQVEGRFALRWTPTKLAAQIVLMRLGFGVDAKENYYGLGEYFDQVAHRGTIRAMQIIPDLKLQSGYNEAHYPVPFFTGTRAWGLFVESYRPGVFDMAKSDAKRIEVTYHASSLTFHWMAAKRPLDVPGLYTQVTGAPALPARWAFGTLLWRDENKDQAEVLEDAANIRKHDLAISGLWIDRPYDTHVNNFRFSTKRYPDAKAMVTSLHKDGFRLGLWSTPYVEKGAEKHDFVKQKNWFVTGFGFPLNKWSPPLDLTNPEVQTFWKDMIKRMTDLGIEGFKLDYGEDIQVGFTTQRTPFAFHNGEDERTMHHRYMLFYHKPYAASLPKAGGFLLCRGGTFGSQKYVSIVWPGDLNTGFQKHYECTRKDGKCYVGGLPAAVIGDLTLSQSGFPFYGSDTGGYRDTRPTKEAFMRWGQQTAFSTVMQIGGPDPNVNPWDFTKYGPSQFDQDVLDMYRRYIRLHTRLFPYLYTYAKHAAQHKPGPTRPYGMAFPNEGLHPNDQYMLGDFLLVAPVVTKGATSKKVALPKGTEWLDWWEGKRYKGGQSITYKAPLDRLPLFLKVGAILPLLRPTIDTLSPSTNKDVDSFANKAGALSLKLVPGAESQFTLYEGTVATHKGEGPFTLTLKAGSEFNTRTVQEWLGLQAPSQVKVDGKALDAVSDAKALQACKAQCWYYDKTRSVLWISTEPTATIEVAAQRKP